MRVSLVCSLLLLSCLTVAVVTAQELQEQEIEYATTTTTTEQSFDTSQYRGSRDPPFFTHFPNNTVLISVNGESRIEIPADYAIIHASVEAITRNMSGPVLDSASVIRDVSEQTATAMRSVLDILKGTTNVTQIKTTHVQLSPIYNYTSGGSILVGYRAIASISFRVDLASAGSVLDSALRAGLNRIDWMTYSASSDHITAARTRAIQEAIKDAQMQAKAMMETIPTTATPEIFKVDMISATSPGPVSMPRYYATRRGGSAALMAPSPIVGGNLVIEARVRVRFMVKKDSIPNPPSFLFN